MAEAIQCATDAGAHVINLSLAPHGESMVMEWAVNYAYERGDVVIDVADNENQSTVGYPAAYDRAVVVAAVNNSFRPHRL